VSKVLNVKISIISCLFLLAREEALNLTLEHLGLNLGCPILAVFASVGIFRTSTLSFPITAESKPPPFEAKGGAPAERNIPIAAESNAGWGTRRTFSRV